MKKTGRFLLAIIVLFLVSCSPDTVPPLGGGYQSEVLAEYVVQMGIQPDDKTFVEYINNREVDRGTYEEKSGNVYLFKGERQEFEITLSSEDSFTITIPQLNEKEPIELKNISKVPSYSSTEYDDVEEYEKLFDENKQDWDCLNAN